MGEGAVPGFHSGIEIFADGRVVRVLLGVIPFLVEKEEGHRDRFLVPPFFYNWYGMVWWLHSRGMKAWGWERQVAG